MILRVYWSITTKIQYVRNIADSHRNKSSDHSESFAFPIKESHDGPADPASGWKCLARIRRTTSLSMSTPNAKEICWAMRLQPQVRLRRFISFTASINSFVGPFGPGRRTRLGENSSRYFCLISIFENATEPRSLRRQLTSKHGLGASAECTNRR